MEQFLKTKISFTPQVIDAFSGMMCTAHFLLKNNVKKELIVKAFENYYRKEPFVKIVKGVPEIKDVKGSNYCHIGGFEIDENNQLVIVAVIDNLVKGASGQAVQNMNLMFKIDETEGLK